VSLKQIKLEKKWFERNIDRVSDASNHVSS